MLGDVSLSRTESSASIVTDPTPSAALEAVLTEIVRRIRQLRDPDLVVLFGSHARGDARPDSDLDLLVVLPGTNRPRQESVVLSEALSGLGFPVDLVVVSTEDLARFRDSLGLVYRPALQEGVVIYERAAA